MRNILIITQRVDEEDDLLGFFIGWLRELSKYFDRIFVIALAVGKYTLPENITILSLGKEHHALWLVRAWRLVWHLAHSVPRSSGVFVHMSPIFAIAAWPFTVLCRKKLVLWYLHRSVTWKLKLAITLSNNVFTADTDSLRIVHPKIMAIGHGIDVEKFKVPVRDWDRKKPLSIISVGRISPIKNLETLVGAASLLKQSGVRFTIKIIGRPIMRYDDSYFEHLKNLVRDADLANVVTFAGFISHNKISAEYVKADIVVGLTPPGGIDKALLEAMAAGCIPITSNTVMAKYLGPRAQQLIFNHGDAKELAERLQWVAELSSQVRSDVSQTMQKSVASHHNLQILGQRIAEIFIT